MAKIRGHSHLLKELLPLLPSVLADRPLQTYPPFTQHDCLEILEQRLKDNSGHLARRLTLEPGLSMTKLLLPFIQNLQAELNDFLFEHIMLAAPRAAWKHSKATDRLEADEVADLAFMHFRRYLNRFPDRYPPDMPVDELDNVLAAFCNNVARNLLRANIRRRRRLPMVVLDETIFVQAYWEGHQHKDDLALVLAHLKKYCSPAEKSVLELLEQGFPCEEIAQILKVSINAVHQTMTRIRRRARECPLPTA